MRKWKKFLSLEVGIEMKACLYFAIILFFYFCYQMIQGSLYASIVCMFEMVLAAYAMCYLQVYGLKNFDESEHFDKGTIAFTLFGAAFYTLISYFLSWYGRDKLATVCFFFYMILCYVCISLIYKIKRNFDTEELNQDLMQYKHKKKAENIGEKDAGEESGYRRDERSGEENFDGK